MSPIHRRLVSSNYQRSIRACGILLGLTGIALLAANLSGYAFSLRSPGITASFGDLSHDSTLPYGEALRQLESLDLEDRAAYASEVNRIVGHTMAHVTQRQIRETGRPRQEVLDFYRMRVPIWENYLLFALSYVKPDTYRDYEFCRYRKAMERGTGRCGQQSLTVVGILAEKGFETGFVNLTGHVVATAKVSDDQWYVLDPDFGVTIPHGLDRIETDRRLIASYYSPRVNTEKLYFSETTSISYGGPDVRWRRACRIESAVYALKWLLPVGLIVAMIGLYAWSGGRGGRPSRAS